MTATTDDASASRCLLREWERRTRNSIDAHNWAERHFDRLNAACLVASIASLTALGVLAAAFDLTVGNNRFVVVAVSVIAATASVLLGVRDYGAKAAAHRTAAREYSALRRQIERATLLTDSGPEQLAAIAALEQQWNSCSEAVPNVPQRLRKRAEKQVRPLRVV